MLTLESPWILNRIADASLKSAAILAAAATVVFLLRRRSAALRHWVWLVALIGTVALPLVSPLAPSWRVRMQASWRAANAATVATTVNASQPPAGNQGASSAAEMESVERELSSTEIPAAGSTNEPTTERRKALEVRSGALTADVRETSGVANWLCGIWALGAATIALQWLAGLASVRSLERHAVPLVTAQWRPVYERAAAALKLRRHVTLCESSRVETPLTWGTWRAVVALPVGHTDWPAEQLRAVLVHELAHVKRHDCLAQLLARVACALYWFHPLVWLAARQLRMEAERACDDCALSDGIPGADYASYLVAVARAGRSTRGATIAAIAFTRTSRLERRVRAVLDVTVGRQPVSPVMATMIAVAAIGCFGPLAAVRPTVKGEEPEARPTASPPGSHQHEQTSVARQTLSVWGAVVGADGQPIAGATVYLREAPTWTKSDLHSVPTRNLAQTLTDAVGSFEFRDLLVAKPSSPREFIFPLDVIATAPDAGLAWRRVKAPPSTSLRMTLAAGQTVRGRLVEPNGRPAAGVNVKVREISALDDPIHRTLGSMRHVDLESSEVSLSALTDADGQFSLGGLPPAVRATLWIDDERYVPQDIYAATTDEPQPALIDHEPTFGSLPRAIPVYTQPFVVQMTLAYRLFGRVMLAEGGRPAVGAGWCEPPIIGPPKRRIGPDGRFNFERLRPGHLYFEITPPPDSGYLGMALTMVVAGESHDIETTIELPRGEVVAGQVIDDVTGAGIRGARIYYQPEQFDERNPRPFASNVNTDDDGRFRIAVPTGKGELILAGSVPGYLTHDRPGPVNDAPAKFHRAIDVRPGSAPADVRFAISPGSDVTGRVVDPEGRTVEGVRIEVQRFHENSRSPPTELTSDREGGFTLRGLLPTSRYEIRCREPARGLAGTATLTRPDELQEALVIKLASMGAVEGRVLNEQGQPLVGAAVRLYQRRNERSGAIDDPVAADAEGRFVVHGLLQGATYYVHLEAEGYMEEASAEFQTAGGTTHRLGDVVMLAADQDVAGVVVDGEGRPVVGAAIYGIAWNPPRSPHSVAMHTETRLTDSQGRFRVRGLPKGQALIMGSFVDNRKHQLGTVETGTQDARFKLLSDAVWRETSDE